MATDQEFAPGDRVWFEYHCLEAQDSADLPAWQHTHQRVTVLAVQHNDADTLTRAERAADGQPYTYTARWDDGLVWDVFEDELSKTTDVWFRPDYSA